MYGDGWHFSEGREGAGKRDGTRSEKGEKGGSVRTRKVKGEMEGGGDVGIGSKRQNRGEGEW
jgi:hypothetical protein